MRPLSPSQKLRLARARSSAQSGGNDGLGVVKRGDPSRPARSRISKADQKAFSGEVPSASGKHPATNGKVLRSKKEMQSINERLTTLNGELEETLERQRATSDDLQNVLYSTNVATIFLDVDLNIRFFTPATRLLFNVRPIDIGRPLSDMTCLAIDETLLADAKEVLQALEPVEREIEARSGAWYLRRILPYRTQASEIEGVVITFADITHRKEAADALSGARMEADAALPPRGEPRPPPAAADARAASGTSRQGGRRRQGKKAGHARRADCERHVGNAQCIARHQQDRGWPRSGGNDEF